MDNELQFIADEIERLYYRIKARRLGVTFVSPILNKAPFIEAAKVCIENKADPEIYVYSQFAHADCERSANFLHSNKAKDYYQKYVDEMALSYDESLEVQKQYLTNQIIHCQRSVEEALMHDGADFTPWFRICITKEPNKEVIHKYQDEARKQLTPKLKKFLESKKLDYKRIKND